MAVVSRILKVSTNKIHTMHTVSSPSAGACLKAKWCIKILEIGTLDTDALGWYVHCVLQWRTGMPDL